MTSSFQILLRREWRTLDESAPSFQNSGRMLFHLTSFPFFRAFRDLLTSTMVLFPVRKTSDGPSRSCVFSGAGLFKSSWRCSFHWVSWPSVLVRSPPLLSLTGLLWTVLCPLSSFVMSKTFFMSLCFAATSACYMVSSIFLLLSSLQLLVTSCLFLLYKLVPFNFCFLVFAASIFQLVSTYVSSHQVSRCFHSSMPSSLFFSLLPKHFLAGGCVYFFDFAPLLLNT